MNQHFVDAKGVNRVIFADEPRPKPRPSTVKPGDSRPGDAKLAGAREHSDSPSGGAMAVEEVDEGNVVASAEIPRSVLPEMLRVKDYFERWGQKWETPSHLGDVS